MAGSSGEREQLAWLWVNPGPLECGILYSPDRQAGGNGRFSLHQLRKILVYARSKGKHAYPWLSYSVWSHIAKNKLHLSEELAWLYFETFDVISDVTAEERVKLLDMTAKCSTAEELDQLKKRVSVDMVKFVLFLYIQNAPRLSLKTPIMTGDEWPSPESEKKQKSSEYAHLSFLKTHIGDVLQLLSEAGGVSGNEQLSVEGLRALEFLVQASQDRKTLCPLTDLARTKTEAHKAGYSKISETFMLPKLEQWVRANLSFNPFGPHALKTGSRDKSCPCYRSESFGRIVSNTHTAPEGSRCVLLHKINKQTLAKGEEQLSGSHMYIQNCRESSIYLLAPLRAVEVERCSHCLLVLGAVETVLSISNCDSITVVAVCRRVHVSSSSLCTLHLCTATRPIIFPSTHNLTLAPHNAHYPRLPSHTQQCGLLPEVNQWNNPLCLGTAEDDSQVWHVMPPEIFRPLAVPFKMEGGTQDKRSPLPKEYQDELTKRKERIKEWYEVVKEAHLTEEQAKQLQTSVQAKFQDWLDVTGYRKEILDLELPKRKKQ